MGPSKTIFLVIALISFNGCKEDEGLQRQLITNGSVEAGSTAPDDWWYYTGQNKYEVNWTDLESFSPPRSLNLAAAVEDNSDFAFWAQTISSNLPKGKAVTLAVKIKSNLEGTGASIAIRGDDTFPPAGSAEQFVTTEEITPISGTFDWTEYTIKLDDVETSTQSLTVYLMILPNTTGVVYFDDVSLSF